jgi:ferredoxin
MYKKLKWIRVGVAVLFFVLFFLSFTFLGRELGNLPKILHFQFVPSLLSFVGGGVIILIFFILLTLCFGRVYCSVICPLGILQDIISRFASLFKSKKGRYTHFTPAHNILRYSILGLVFITLILGFTDLLLLLDPYSNFGRITTQLFDTALIWFLNIFSNIFPDSVYYRSLSHIVWNSFAFAALFFVVIIVMSAFKGRLYCNTICPVGSFLGLISKASLFKLKIDDASCVGCTLCTKNCKSGCIDGKNHIIDESRCVMCLDCMTVCRGGAIKLVNRRKNASVSHEGRREAIAAISALGAVLVARGVKGDKKHSIVEKESSDNEAITGIVPPGGVSIEHLQSHCTACHACIAACPSRIISPAVGEYGLGGLLLPVVHYDRHFCGFNCNKCSQVCPNGALKHIPIEQKQRTQVGRVTFIAKNCIVFKSKTDCGACDEHCPTKAITMKEWSVKKGLFHPSINADICIGCGACEYICPATPKAMIIKPLSVHSVSHEPVKEAQEKKNVTDFGF